MGIQKGFEGDDGDADDVDADELDRQRYAADPEAPDEALLPMRPRKRIALAARGERREDLLAWALRNADRLSLHDLFAPEALAPVLTAVLDLPVEPLSGGDRELGPLVALTAGALDLVIAFVDPRLDVDPVAAALVREAARWDVALACNRATADFLVRSPLMLGGYRRAAPAGLAAAPA